MRVRIRQFFVIQLDRFKESREEGRIREQQDGATKIGDSAQIAGERDKDK